ncbi:MAG: ATP-dependent protease ATPase subunit HslU [Spirochaetaceae bacterium]|jgi:ATP-dependent HslUV protease ATP-binding subunit HslU|nr:ATP-dependent protease ATPase subunit HslU [Spirochaetaceae bacterium]
MTVSEKKSGQNLDRLTPREIVSELDKYIIGQKKAKRAVAVALRNRIRRLKIDPELREDIAPKNILMIGPTGVGKTEIARRLAKLAGSPFIKVEATKYTEVGYVGRDVESMIRDLMAVGVQMVKQEMQESVTLEAGRRVEETLLDLLLPGTGKKPKADNKPGAAPVVRPMGVYSINPGNDGGSGPALMGAAIQVGIPVRRDKAGENKGGDAAAGDNGVPETETEEVGNDRKGGKNDNPLREKFRALLQEGKLEDRMVEITVNQTPQFPSIEMLGGGMEELESSLSGIAGFFGGNKKKKLVSVSRAREILIAEETEKLIDRDRVSDEARQRVEETGIVFIDEIDKIAVKGDRGGGPDVSREGVQRDILPIVEGAAVTTKWGPVNTDHILFIAAGAFNVSKPSDLIPELQGRFPLRVELESLGKEEFLRILTEPKNALTKQYIGLLATEGVDIAFDSEAIERLATLAADVNSKLENIGARRLHTIMEALLEDLSFEAPDISPAAIPITGAYVAERLTGLATNQDLGRYIL